MPTFQYKVKDARGNTRTGTLEAANEQQAAAMIREAGGYPMEIRPAKAGSSSDKAYTLKPNIRNYLLDPIWSGVNIRALAYFYTQLQTMLNAGMTLSEALASAGGRTGGRLGSIVNEASTHVRNGGKLSEVMGKYPRIFNRMQMSLMRAGESGGLLESMVGKIASYLGHEIKIRQQLAKILFYPYLILFCVIVMPHVPTLILASPSAFFMELWSSIRIWLPSIILAVLIVKYLFLLDQARLVWDIIKIQPPVLGTMARKIATSRFCRALSALYSAGMPMAEALSISADTCANIAIGNAIKRAIKPVQAGEKLTTSLASTGMIMPIVLDMLSTGEKTGDMDAVMVKSADYMDEEVDVTIHKTGILLFVLMILIAGAVVGTMVFRYYEGYFSDIIKSTGQ